MSRFSFICGLVIVWIITLLVIASQVKGQDFNHVSVTKVYDGDTITVNIPDVPPVFGEKLSIRLYGIDTPEIRGKCLNERIMALAARNVVHNLIQLNDNIVDLKDCERGKYFRLVCGVHTAVGNISEILLEQHLAYVYFGATKQNTWCEEY